MCFKAFASFSHRLSVGGKGGSDEEVYVYSSCKCAASVMDKGPADGIPKACSSNRTFRLMMTGSEACL